MHPNGFSILVMSGALYFPVYEVRLHNYCYYHYFIQVEVLCGWTFVRICYKLPALVLVRLLSLMDECFCSCAILSRNVYYQSRKESKPSIVTSSGKRPERNEMKRIDQWQQKKPESCLLLEGD